MSIFSRDFFQFIFSTFLLMNHLNEDLWILSSFILKYYRENKSSLKEVIYHIRLLKFYGLIEVFKRKNLIFSFSE